MATSTGAAAQIHPQKALGFIALGSSLHHVLSRLRYYDKVFTSISTIHDPASPSTSPVIILLDNNGIRLRFDGVDQRLRLIEVIDFKKCRLTYHGGELTRQGPGGPTCKSIYHKSFGPTYPGEYLESSGLYVLSYPGVAFSFPVDKATWKEDVDFVSQLAHTRAKSMAVFSGESWMDVRDDLFTRPVQSPRIPSVNVTSSRLSSANDEVECVKFHEGRVEIVRRHNPPFWVILHSTTPQDIICELGPPDAIYRKSDHRLNIHRARSAAARNHVHDEGDESEPDDAATEDEEDISDLSATSNSDCFYNYFSHGIDIFVSAVRSSSHPVATKVIAHGNVLGSYEFQRYRRCRWFVESPNLTINSEQAFDEVSPRLRERFGEIGKPMPYSRGSDSPSSSCELLGGWEDSDALADKTDGKTPGGLTFGNTGPTNETIPTQPDADMRSELYGFPGFVFEVLSRNKAVTCVTVF